MRFRKIITDEVAERLVSLGLNTCPVCGTGAMRVDRRPAILHIGGFHKEKDDPLYDPEANALFMLRVECEVCGYNLLFNSEKHTSPDEVTLLQHWVRDEDDMEDNISRRRSSEP